MTSLWLAIAALLIVALGFMCWPLLPFFRNKQYTASIGMKQENIEIFRDRLAELEYEKSQGNLEEDVFLKLKTELEKSLLQDTAKQENLEIEQVEVSGKHWMVAMALSLAVTVVSLGMYFNLGRSGDLLVSQAMAGDAVVNHQADSTQQQEQTPPPSMGKSIEILEAKLEQDPTNMEKLYLLANSYSAVSRFDKAVEIFGRMANQVEAGSEEYASYKGAQAQSLFQATGEKMTPGVVKLTKEALSIDPQEPSSLMLKGINAFTSSEYQQAVEFWEKAKIKSGEQQIARFIEPAIKAAQEKMGVTVAKTESKQATTQPNAASSASVIVNLSISEALKSRVKADDIIFVFARPVGGRMPLAAERIRVQDLPKTIVLDDTKAAMPTAKISSVETVEVIARVSLSGRPMQEKGDLFATTVKVNVKDSPTIKLEINKIAE